MQRIAFIGSRSYTNLVYVKKMVKDTDAGTTIITGGWAINSNGDYRATRGVDRAAAIAAESSGRTLVLVSGSTTVHGRYAGLNRNRTIIELADRVFAFWDEKSRGTLRGIRIAQELGKPIIVWDPEGIPITPGEIRV